MLQPIGLSKSEIFRYYATFSSDRRVCGHSCDDLLKGVLPRFGRTVLGTTLRDFFGFTFTPGNAISNPAGSGRQSSLERY